MDLPELNTLPERLKWALASAQARQPELTQRGLATACGWDESRLAHYLKGTRTPDADNVLTLAKAFASFGVEVPPAWFLYGGISNNGEGLIRYENLNPAVPVISLSVAAEQKMAPYTMQGLIVVGPVERPEFPMGKESFAFHATGWAMHDEKYGIKPGYILFCDPGLTAEPGDLVVASAMNGAEPICRQLVKEEGRWLLRALNKDPAYHLIPIENPADRVIATVTHFRAPAVRLR